MYNALLFIEVKGVDYPEDANGAPILPLFATQPIPAELLTHFYGGIQPGSDVPEPIIFETLPPAGK